MYESTSIRSVHLLLKLALGFTANLKVSFNVNPTKHLVYSVPFLGGSQVSSCHDDFAGYKMPQEVIIIFMELCWKHSCHSLHIISLVNADCSPALLFIFDLQLVLKQTNFLFSAHIHTPTNTQRQKSIWFLTACGWCVRRPKWAVAVATYFEPERAVYVGECMCIILLVRVILTRKKKPVDTSIYVGQINHDIVILCSC